VRNGTTLAALCLLCTACGGGMQTPLPLGQEAYAVIPAATQAGAATNEEYVIGPLDTVNVTVFQEPDLSANELKVDAAGNILLPLVGTVRAGGKTASELSSEITGRLTRYLVRPSVTVTANSITQKVTIEGSVNQPGVYEIKGSSSLLEALAMARSPTEVAALDQVIVFRNVDGQRTGAAFDLRRIRVGLDPDPVIKGGDRIVVGYSAVKGAWRDFLSMPIFNIFRRF
jgi:polysaccharide export outer membrane protein